MKQFNDENFLLQTPAAERLYHEHAAKMPIIDYHCHVSPKEIAEDKQYSNITELWLGGDHYKWRQMRTNGIDEKFITGDADDYDKWEKFAETMPLLIGNPLYHWTHLELKRYFDIDDILIICDDLDTKVGTYRLRYKGSSGGHNGLKNIESHLKTKEYK